ncbi:MAG: haloalkane dehalogenase [Candidatus Binataceae bacterium]
MKILRTPDERFANLPGYAFAPHYLEIDGIRVHYVDEGGARNGTVMLMHGEPSWSFLYRKMIPAFVAAGIRAIAPDLVGFGRSDKPADRDYYTYQRHVDWMAAWLRRLDLRDLTLVCQDWGGLIGLRLVADRSERFSRIVAANTGLPTGDGLISEAFKAWQKFSRETPQFPVGQIVAGGCARPLAPEIIAAYDAPFPDDSYKAGARQFPLLVPTSPDDPAAPANRRAWEVLRRWKRPFLTAFSDSDPITHGGEAILQAQIPGAQGQPHTTITGGGHFLQEDQGEEFARVVIDFIRSTNRQGDFR